MKILLTVIFLTLLVNPVLANDLGNTRTITKDLSQIRMNPGTPDGRDGGEDISTAIVIESLPFSDTGNTSDNLNDYDSVCPYSGSTAPDVVYSFTPAVDLSIIVDLCGSGYDTKTYILNHALEVIACNDDFYTDDLCGLYVSLIEHAPLVGGTEYFIVIDGYGEEAGDFVLQVDEYIAPPECILTCNGVNESEPPLHDGYVDTWNTGCNDDSGLFPFQNIGNGCSGPPELTFCGKSGWYGQYRDTDWFIAFIGVYGIIEWTLDAELPTLGFLLSPQDCASVGVEESMEAGPCSPSMMAIQGNPGDMVWLWVGPTEYTPPEGFVGHEYDYICDFEGLEVIPGVTATEGISLDRIKSLYR